MSHRHRTDEPLAADTAARESALLESISAELGAIPSRHRSSVTAACEHVRSTKGSHWRGRLVLAAATQGPNANSPQLLRAACAIELLHVATLLHDDLIDSGSVRRGVPTAGAVFGQRAASLAGAKVFARAVELVALCGDWAVGRFANGSFQLCSGGMREFESLGDVMRTEEDYLRAAEGKTAAAFATAASLGARLAEARIDVVTEVWELGLSFGLAYQIWDDLTDLLVSPQQSGKAQFSDLRHGLLTLPAIYALEESVDLRRALAAVDQEFAGVDVLAMIAATNGIERTAQKAAEMFDRAMTSSRELPQPKTLNAYLTDARRRHEAALT